MTLTYIFHSGFVLETEKSILIFDYWQDLNGVVPSFLKKDKPVYVFFIITFYLIPRPVFP